MTDPKTILLVEDEAIIAMEQSEGKWNLKISNSGNPFPENMGFDNPSTLGLRLISALVGQLEGEIDVIRHPNPVFTIVFPGNDG